MSELPIDRGVPIPPTRKGPPTDPRWNLLEVGDSFVLDEGNINRVQQRCWNHGYRCDKKFVCRRVENGMIRIWRTR